VKVSARKGNGTQGQSFGGGPTTAGHVAVFDADGNVVDGGVPSTASLVIGFVINSGTVGTNVGKYAIAPRTGTLSKCKVAVASSDGSTQLVFTIKKNGTAVFTTSPTIAAGAAAGTLSTFTGLTSSPLSVAADDLFTIDITSGSSSWAFTAQLES
jgi:hypothetical protein